MTPADCAACGSALPPDAKFCVECGAATSEVCASCGTPSAGGKFCAECGHPLPGTGAVISAAAPGEIALPVAERRLVSLLFADLVGFTTLSEARDPEDVRELLSAYFERARAVIERYGGTVEKFIGDAVCAVWGVPVAREDDAERAVRAGLDLASTVTALGEDVGLDGLSMRVGITTGQVAVTLGAVGEGMVAGDAVNTAARVQSVAKAGQVWVDDTTRSLTTASLAFAPVGAFDLKGKSVPVQLFHAVRTTGHVGGGQRVDGLEAPFVGRDRDLRLVKELFHATIEEDRPRLLLIEGEPGIGKSRLAWEFEKYVDAIPTHTTYWMRARCLSYGEGVAGRVVAELIRYLLRLTDADDDVTARTVLRQRLEKHVSDERDRAVIGPRLESLLGLSTETFEAADLFACWRAFLEALHSTGDSVTMVIEDLQWADSGLLDFIEHLLEAARAPIFMLAIARPEVSELRPGLGSGRRSTTVFLEPLPSTAMANLLDGLVEGLSPDLRDELVGRSEGVPLYGVETVRALIDRDIVVPRDGRYNVDPVAAAALDLDALGPPTSLQSLLAARLDALSDGERRVVQDASVLGLAFTTDGIRALAPLDVALDDTLESLRRKEIFTIESDPRSPERGQLRFVQALLRTVAYDTLSRRDRQARHLAAAEFLAGQANSMAMAAVISEHYLDAVAAMPEAPEAASAQSEATRLLEHAAEHARSVGAAGNAMTLYSRVLSLDPPDDTYIRVALRRLDLATHLYEYSASVREQCASAIELARRAGRESDVLELRRSLATLAIRTGDDAQKWQGELLDVMESCLGQPERVGTLVQTVRALCLCAQALGNPESARDVTQRALDDVERYGDDSDFATYLQAMSMHYGIAGYRRLTTMMRRAAIPLFDDRDPTSLPVILNLVATLFNDGPAEAWSYVEEVRRREDALGVPAVATEGHATMLAALLGTPEAIALAREMIERSLAMEPGRSPDWESYQAAAAAKLAWRLGEPDLVVRSAISAESIGDPVAAGWLYMYESVVAAFDGDTVLAGQLAATAFDRMADLGLAHEDMPACYGLAVEMLHRAGMHARLEELTARLESLSMGQRYRLTEALLAEGRALLSDDPIPGLRLAAETFDRTGAGFEAARVRVMLAEHLLAAGRDDEATGVLAAAEPVLTDAGATPALDRIAALRQSSVIVS